MLRKLRLKFIVLNMVIVAIVLIVAFSSICLFSRQQEMAAVRTAFDASLSIAGESSDMHNRGSIGKTEDVFGFGMSGPEGQSDVGGSPDAESLEGREIIDSFEEDAGLGIEPPEIGGRRTGPSFQPNIPVATYRIVADGSLKMVASGTTAIITTDVLNEAARLLAGVGDGFGEFDSLGLLYEKRTIGFTAYVAFADSAEASNWKNLALTLCGVGILVLAIFFVISLFFSKWALKPVEKAWETQTRFVADASHDLKTPLTIILANTSIMRKHPDATVSEMEQWLESTECEAHEMQTLVGDMLVLAQLDEANARRRGSGASTAETKPVNLSKIAEAEVLQFESVAFESGLSLTDEIEEGIELAGDEARLKRLMATLIDNACKYANMGGSIEVKLARASDGKQAIFSVFNTGSAIPEEDLPYVFDRFYRVDKSRSERISDEKDARERTEDAKSEDMNVPAAKKSHGLGLAIALGIAEEHRGELTVTSNEEEGTRFVARFPL